MNTEAKALDNVQNQESNDSKDSLDFEAKATELGWVPKEKFRGDPAKHVDAKTYYEKGELVLPLVKKQRDDFRAHAEKSDKQIAELKSAMGDFRKLVEADADRKVKAEIAALKEVRAAAVAAGDDKAYKQADDAIDEIREVQAKPKEIKVEQPTGDPEFEAWVQENEWYKSDAKRRRLANSIGLDLTAENPNLKGTALFKAVSDELERIESEKSGAERAGPQRGGKTIGSNSKAKTFGNMLPEFKGDFAKLKKAGLPITEESYAAKVGPEAWGA